MACIHGQGPTSESLAAKIPKSILPRSGTHQSLKGISEEQLELLASNQAQMAAVPTPPLQICLWAITFLLSPQMNRLKAFCGDISWVYKPHTCDLTFSHPVETGYVQLRCLLKLGQWLSVSYTGHFIIGLVIHTHLPQDSSLYNNEAKGFLKL